MGVEEKKGHIQKRHTKESVMSDFYIGLAHYVVDCTRSVFGLHRLPARPSFCSWYGHHGCFSGVKLNVVKKKERVVHCLVEPRRKKSSTPDCPDASLGEWRKSLTRNTASWNDEYRSTKTTTGKVGEQRQEKWSIVGQVR